MSTHPKPWRRGSVFGQGYRQPLDREARAVWRAKLIMFRRAGKLTPLHEDIGLAMLRRLGQDGQLDPCHETVATDVGCSSRSVRRALVALRACGLLTWAQRLVRAGWRVVQTSSAYCLMVNSAVPAAAFCSGGQSGRPTRRDSFLSTSLRPAELTQWEIAAARDALAERRRVIEERLLTKGSA